MLAKDRKFGQIPDWAKQGPISLKNYCYRAEWHGSIKSAERGGEHPTVRLGTPEWLAWKQYFERHLGGLPYVAKLLINGSIEILTVPEIQPEWFDPSFVPDPNYRHRP